MRLDPITLQIASAIDRIVVECLTTLRSNVARPTRYLLTELASFAPGDTGAGGQQVMPDDHSAVEPLLPIPNRTVKRRSADDSEHLACESRTLSGNYRSEKATPRGGFFVVRDGSSVRLT